MITLRRAEIADVPAIVEFSHSLFQEDAGQRDPTMNLNWAHEYGVEYFTWFIEQPNHIIFMALSDEMPVGYLAGDIRGPDEMRDVKSAELESTLVIKDFRAQGVGRALANAFIQWSRENGAARIVVTAYSANENALAFYQRLGFEPKNITLEMSLV